MKLKKIVSGICGLSLAVGMSSVTAQQFPPEGPNPKLTMGEEGAFVLAESILSITAAFVTRSGCGATTGGPYSIAVDVNGNGSATYGGGSDPIVLNVASTDPVPFFGTHYFVLQKNHNADPRDAGFLDAANSIADYDGQLSYSDGGAILISNSDFYMKEFVNWIHWDEHNIKDFWLQDPKDNGSAVNGSTPSGQYIKDAGLEVITKITYPLTKWRQTSWHRRWDGQFGFFEADKWLITPYNAAECHIHISGNVGQQGGVFQSTGTVSVGNF